MFTHWRERARNGRVYRAELRSVVLQLGGYPIDGATVRARVARAWLSVKWTLLPGGAPSLFNVPEYGDKTIISTYYDALQNRTKWPEGIRAMLNRHWISIRRIDEVKSVIY
ncbi:MAG: hypothetical protein HC859_05480 [Bacteroidia bacterium]|nr:hypothetical protein [Bacteroidia bacterium]